MNYLIRSRSKLLLKHLKHSFQPITTTLITMDPSELEQEIGITEYTNNAKGFKGIHKQRFSDFVVREVDIDGSIVYLKELSGNDLEKKYFTKKNDTNNNDMINNDLNPIELAKQTCIELKKHLINAVSDEKMDENLINFIEACINKSNDCDDSFITYSCTNKESRTEMHKCIRNHVGAYIETDTISINDIQHLRLYAKHKLKKSNGKSYEDSTLMKRDKQWPKELGDYLRFTLLKENIDTMSACNILGKTFRLNANNIGYNGTKDKRAVTTQKVTIFRRRPSEIERMNKFKYPPIIRVGDFEYVKEPAKLGQHVGNHFEIVLRAINETDEIIHNACHQLKQNGFINYYGLQRFGKGGTKSHIIGKALYRSEWKMACDMLFTSLSSDKNEIQEVKRLYHLSDYKGALNIIPSQLHSEKNVLESLLKDPTNYSLAFSRIVKNNRLICIHAYQSYVWNIAVSERIRLYGMNCIVGDLVSLNENEKAGVEENVNEEIDGKFNVHALTQEDIDLGTYKMIDVMLPLPGYDIILPNNSMKDFYIKLLEKDGLSLEHFSKCDINYRSKGTYRHIIQFPKSFEYAISTYDDPNEEINTTELTRLRQIENNESSSQSSIPLDKKDNDHRRALTLKFTLLPGIYATMVLREITKESTETDYLIKLTSEENSKFLKEKRELVINDDELNIASTSKKLKR